MADVVVFHHAQGRTEGVLAFADALRADGHRVHVPDLYGGATFATLAAGVAHLQELGFEAVLERAERAVDDLPDALAYVGFSLGVAPAQKLAMTRPGARAAVLVSACFPPAEFAPAWPAGVPVQVHAMADDPEFDNGWDLPAAKALVDGAPDRAIFLYPGDAHLFADASLTAYVPDAAARFEERVRAFLRAA